LDKKKAIPPPSTGSKRCPHCFTELPLDAVKCAGCDRKVGNADRHGRAKEPIDWVAYSICAFACLVFASFVWWGFFR